MGHITSLVVCRQVPQPLHSSTRWEKPPSSSKSSAVCGSSDWGVGADNREHLRYGAAFQEQYPHHTPATRDWSVFLIYEALFLFYWIGWEYLWRGFVLFGTAPTFGVHAIFVQTLPFAVLHVSKPWPEALLSIVGGIALGALVWRCRSFWIAVPIHAAQMMLLDFWCTLRVRTGASGIGLEAFFDLVAQLGG